VIKRISADLALLLTRIEDEFRDVEGVRIRPVFPSSTKRSPDLAQDYDPGSAGLHRSGGVSLQTRRHEYFFPEEWASMENHAHVVRLIDEIRESLSAGQS
jgi:hypothetical protein